MQKFKAQVITGFVLIFTFYLLPFNIVSAAPCSPSTPKVVAHTGEIEGALDSLATKDGQGITLTDGSLTIDLGCFADHEGADLRLYVIGRSHGAQVSVGRSLSERLLIGATTPPHYQLFVCTRSECGGYKPPTNPPAPGCDGKETLPNAMDGCVTGDQWFNLDIGSTALTTSGNGEYRYIYVTSDKSAHIDAIEAIASVSQAVDLYILGDSHLQFLDGAPVGDYNFEATLSGLAAGTHSYTFSCDLNHTVPIEGTLTILAGQSSQVGPFACNYSTEGLYQANITLDGNVSSAMPSSDSAGVLIGEASVAGDSSKAGSGTGNRAILITVGLILALALIFEIVQRARRQPS